MSSTVAPPGFLRLAGHPVRWLLLRELARSDRQVRELTALVGERQSLTSYHLGQLRAGGLVTTRRSSADGRDTYYSLDLAACGERLAESGAALHPGLRLAPPGEPALRAVRVLFLCTGNSSRSQMAEAILGRLGVEAASAGSHPKPVHPLAVRVMRERGVDIAGNRSKHFSEFAGERFDYVISLCDRVREVCPDAEVHWSIPEPDDHPAFVRTAEELETRIRFLLHAIEAAG
ncbi:ArsR family transcriptional regulator [Nonomuraea sp. NPDC050556]|uniref:arsenate reductase/protein-tyrosine-phosphatase family protein n=1 Tax=Nonomuraea sp. NPDC050556 TaxID=3364369 RepID=UPI003789D953